jgi:hypothetical protein
LSDAIGAVALAAVAIRSGGVGLAGNLSPVVIGENMQRVKAYAQKVGGHIYRPWTLNPWNTVTAMRRNQRWIRSQRATGREIIDIGPDFARRSSTGYVSEFYGMERRNVAGYRNYTRAFTRSGSTGGVPGLDF